MNLADDTLTFAEAKRDFDRGLLASSWLERQPMSDEWCVMFRSALRSSSTYMLISTRDRETRRFKSLSAALNMIRDIGFKAERLDVK